MATRRIVSACCRWAAALVLAMAVPTPTPAAAQPARTEASLPTDAAEVYRIYLLGDAGGFRRDRIYPLRAHLAATFRAAPAASAVVFLGDNIYCCGLPDSTEPAFPEAEARLQAQLDLLDGYSGRVVFIPGNHDWNDEQPGGLAAVRHQGAYLREVLGRDDVFLPGGGYPGPVVVELEDDVVLVALDTQWWLTDDDARPYGEDAGYDLEEAADVILELDDVLKHYDDERVLVVGHHPFRSNGTHAGRFPLREHLFPLRRFARKAWVPLPLLGSIYPTFIRLHGGRQDLGHPRYRALRRGLSATFAQHERLVYAAGHDHSLQHFPATTALGAPQHYLVSGSASRTGYVARGGDAAFTSAEHGYMVLYYYDDGSTWLEARGTEDGAGTLLYRTRLNGPSPDRLSLEADTAAAFSVAPGATVRAAANPAYEAGPLKRFFLGTHRRAAWATPVEAPVLDLGTAHGGLSPVKRGGGQQTLSLRLQGGDGHEYVLRSIDKDPSLTVPANLRGTVATDIVQDQIASLHPYGAFIIPPLADAAGLYHTEPELVYVPDDPRLGRYRSTFAGRLMMLEERPDDDESDRPHFGGSDDVVSTGHLFEEIDGDNDHRVDQQWYVRARLFDLLLSDWDRHRDQWRWASFEPGTLDATLTGDAATQGKVYRPIPRDRDWAFNRMDGLFPTLAGYLDPKFQDFRAHYGLLRGLTRNGLELDRRFTNELTRDDWVAAAQVLQQALSDDVVAQAVAAWPAPIRAIDGAETVRLLKQRRDQLDDIARAYYALLARIVDVVGSDKHERFVVSRAADTTRVAMYKTDKRGRLDRELYARAFAHDETEELRLYGQDGNDAFVVAGTSADGPRVIAVGGAGADAYEDRSHVEGRARRTRFYDTPHGTTMTAGAETRAHVVDDPSVHAYDPLHGYRHDSVVPQVFFGANPDDGVFAGGGAKWIRHGFRKTPYAAAHRLVANVAARTQAFNVVYQAHLPQRVGSWGLGLDAEVRSPNSIRNYYGLGNATRDDAGDAEYYQARLTHVRLVPRLTRRDAGMLAVSVGPLLEVTRVRADRDRFVTTPQAGIAPGTFDDQWTAGVRADIGLETFDVPLNPKQGYRWTASAEGRAGLRNTSATFARFASDLAVVLSPRLQPQVSLALRVGGAHNVGDVPFYEANTLGGRDNLRGFRSTRFAGRTTFYQNVELRAQLFTFSTYLALGRTGFLAFLDNGRVWTEADGAQEGSDAFLQGYHQGYGGGIWTTLFDVMALTSTLGFSEDGHTFTLQLGFQY